MLLIKYLAYYQLVYGFVGVLYMASVVADNLDEGAQIFLITMTRNVNRMIRPTINVRATQTQRVDDFVNRAFVARNRRA